MSIISPALTGSRRYSFFLIAFSLYSSYITYFKYVFGFVFFRIAGIKYGTVTLGSLHIAILGFLILWYGLSLGIH